MIAKKGIYISHFFNRRAEILKFNPPINYTVRITVLFFPFNLYIGYQNFTMLYPYRKHFTFYDLHLHLLYTFYRKKFQQKKRIADSTKSLRLHNFYLPTDISPDSFYAKAISAGCSCECS